MAYNIEITEEAKKDLLIFSMYERKTILTSIKEQLVHEPMRETKNKKKLRENPISSWELRSGRYRIFYEVHDDIVTVIIISVGKKEHNVLYIRGQKVKI